MELRGDGSTIFTLGAAPEDRECAVTMNIRTHSEADRETTRHTLDTFGAGCGGIS